MRSGNRTGLSATRRGFLAASAATPFIAAAPAASADTPGDAHDSIARDLQRYIGFGNKQSGGPGDEACGAWLEEELEAIGFRTQRQSFSAPWFNPETSEIIAGDARAHLWPQPIVQTTPPDGLTAPLVRVDSAGRADRPLAGVIALVDLAHARWSSMFWPGVAGPVRAAFEQGALACVIITNGPSGQIIALNTDGRAPLHDRPIALMAPDDAAPFLAAAQASQPVSLTITGQGGRRPAFNLVGTLDRGRGRWLVVSTPRSGWFTCAGERGGGIAAWLHMARWTSRHAQDFDLSFVCNSGHEYQYLGAEELLHNVVPPPGETAFWLHLGANLAARDWHSGVGARRPLPGTDSQRYLVVSPHLVPAAAEEFAGLSGLEAPYSSEELSAGELTNVIEAGYAPVAGIFGVHQFHHVADDDARCVSAAAVTETTLAFQRLLERALR
ncbi:hypothetical protein [Maricaulis sp.]|uniref:hypothetical protein n=1 Tax=Maricaulis sp. TaxID=1486257 RepID=UPI001B015672|nr:hypothetical protein [Maricaulis sp.]MBO6763870.1 hypothetical protein [Maricaulis sp.]